MSRAAMVLSCAAPAKRCAGSAFYLDLDHDLDSLDPDHDHDLACC